MATWSKRVRRWFIAGLILLSPAFITFVAMLWIFNHIDAPMRNLIAWATAELGLGPLDAAGAPMGYHIPGVGVVMTFLLILMVGAIVSTFALQGMIRWFEGTLDRIPLVRTLYSGVKQLMAPLADEHGSTFSKVVIVEYPDSNNYSLGFLIKRDAALSPKGEMLSAVLVPTNHLHLGNVVLCPNTRIHAVDLSAEEGLKFLVSMGAALDRRLLLGGMPEMTPVPGAAPHAK